MPEDVLSYMFDDFVLDVANRQLQQDGTQVNLNARYLDALVLLVREQGQLVQKEQFFNEVWGDVVVSDAALTQCIKILRKQLGDTASNPRYIETVPRYGYRFIGTVSAASSSGTLPDARSPETLPAPQTASNGNKPNPQTKHLLQNVGQNQLYKTFVQGIAGTLGGTVAGALGGLLYGVGLASTPADPQLGTASILLVLVSLNIVLGTIGACGVSFGMTVALIKGSHPSWSIAGAAFGGMFVGGTAKLLSVDAFTLFFGQAPAGITGGLEGAILGAAIALGTYWGGGLDMPTYRRPVIGAGLAGAVAGVLIPLAGGRLLGGSLELLAQSFANSRLQLDALGRFFGEVHFGATTQVVLGGLEGLIFGSCVVGAIVLARRMWLTRA